MPARVKFFPVIQQPDMPSVNLFKREHSESLFANEKVAVLLLNGIGDIVLSLPTLHAISFMFSGAVSLIIPNGSHADALLGVPIKSCLQLDVRPTARGHYFNIGCVIEYLSNCDLFISLNPWHTKLIDRLLNLLRPKHSVGFSPSFNAFINTSATHAFLQPFQTVEYLDPNCSIYDFDVAPKILEDSILFARAIYAQLPSNNRVLFLHTETLEHKTIPTGYFVRILNSFLKKYQDFHIFSVGLSSKDLAHGTCRDRITHFTNLTFQQSMALMTLSDVFLGIDSCMLHLADLFKKPGVGLFKSTDPNYWGFFYSENLYVNLSHKSLSEIESEVIEKLEQALAK